MQLRRPSSSIMSGVLAALLRMGIGIGHCRDGRRQRRRSGRGAEARRAARLPAAPAPAPARQSGYAGSDTCLMCHSDMETTLKGTKHAQALDQRTPAAHQGCESCHGPGQAHVDDDAKGNILKFAKASPAEASGACLNCHGGGAHAAWQGSKHEARNLTCTTCHSVHHPVSPAKQLVKSTETQLCATCHRTRSPRPSAPWRTCRCAKARCRARAATIRTARSAT